MPTNLPSTHANTMPSTNANAMSSTNANAMSSTNANAMSSTNANAMSSTNANAMSSSDANANAMSSTNANAYAMSSTCSSISIAMWSRIWCSWILWPTNAFLWIRLRILNHNKPEMNYPFVNAEYILAFIKKYFF
jgi:hypothetical protein